MGKTTAEMIDMQTKGAVFFLAANSSKGFFSLFDELYDYDSGWKAYIIKGGPGTGKSGLMKKVAQRAEEYGYEVEKIICSSDPDSLDGVIIPGKKICFADGTSPHVIEPKYPGAVEEILNLGQFWDGNKLYNDREHIKTVTDCNKALHKRSAHYVAAASAALEDSIKLVAPHVSQTKADNYATRFVMRNCVCSDVQGNEKRRFLSGITPKGYVTLFDTAKVLCDRIFSVSDENQYAACVLMQALRRAAISNGVDVITCLNPFLPGNLPLHIIFPKEKIGFFTSDSLQNFKTVADKNINAKRFITGDVLSSHKQRLSFNRKAAADLLGEAVKLLENAKHVHDRMESYYINSMDFDKLNQFTDNIINTIL